MSTPLLIVAWAAIVIAIITAFVYARRATMIRGRLRAEGDAQFQPLARVPDEDMSWLGRWLFVSGFRSPSAPAVFLVCSAAALLVGALVALIILRSHELELLRQKLGGLPGGIGGLVDPVVLLTPWLILIMIALVPWMVVRARRRKRVREIEEDLPMSLQLMATLSRAGLGLDAAMLRLLESSDENRTLSRELNTFRRENLAGLTRSDCWRRLARRVDVTSVSIFTSAMIHAEHVGGGVSEVLEHQTEDVLSRRREQALVQAQALPVKLVFPLVICFLPGIFIWTLGPAFYQFVKLIDGVMRGSA